MNIFSVDLILQGKYKKVTPCDFFFRATTKLLEQTMFRML